MQKKDRFTACTGDFVVITDTKADRIEAFLEPFGLLRGSTTFIDRSGYPLAISSAWIDGLDHFSAAELGAAAVTIARPTRILLLWKPAANGSQLLTRRYVSEQEGKLIVLDVNRAGWAFATSDDPGFSAELAERGTVVYAS